MYSDGVVDTEARGSVQFGSPSVLGCINLRVVSHYPSSSNLIALFGVHVTIFSNMSVKYSSILIMVMYSRTLLQLSESG